jgi:cytochrome c oxidase subunit 4
MSHDLSNDTHEPHQHVDSAITYVLVFLGLIFLTVATTAVAFVDLGPFSVVVALVIACCKMLLVALFFMHVRHSTKLTRLVVVGGLLWLFLLLLLTLGDVMTRGLVGVPGR